MRTEEQKKASRTNGAMSKGPTTDQGKARSAANASRHNLSGDRFMLLSTENPDAYTQHVDDYVDRFQPIDNVERDLVDRMIAASWRDKRADDMEASLFELEMMRQEEDINDEFSCVEPCSRQTLALLGTSDKRQALSLLMRYQSAARRSYSAAIKALRELQGDRFDPGPQGARRQPPH